MKRQLLMLYCLVFLFSAMGYGQFVQGQKSIGVTAAGIKLVGGEGDKSVINYASGLMFKYGFSERWVGEFSASLGWLRPKDPDSYFKVASNAPYRTYVYPLSVGLRYHMNPYGKFTPYVGVGMGFLSWNLMNISGDDSWFPVPESGESIHGRQTNLAFVGALGLECFLQEALSLDLSARYTHMMGQDLDNIGLNDPNEALAEVRLGLNVHFGGFKDRDQDGIEDKYDANPYAPEDFDGYQDEDGAPEPDNDGDGIVDELDQAPNLPEDLDGFQDNDGIPDLDNDNDSIEDAKDECPNEPEDFDGFMDDDGCPDLDNDKDGIPDDKDQCPNEPETYNQYQDEDGCPDEIKEEPIIKQGEALVLPGVTFASGKASLTQNAKNVLLTVFESLKNYPDIEVEIRGFTDSIGNDASNLSLSQRRAEAVKNYLVQLGIPFNRLKAIGYGEANPIASNMTREGRAQNRRIEFVRIN